MVVEIGVKTIASATSSKGKNLKFDTFNNAKVTDVCQ